MTNQPSYDDLIARVRELERSHAHGERVRAALKRRIASLTRPPEDPGEIRLEDLFDIEEIQRLQDHFSRATNVASIITRVDGTPITRPSNFCRLCEQVIRETDRGFANCCKSDAVIGQLSPDGPIIQPCMSGGLWDAGAGISVGGRHIANWLIGQVRDETQTEAGMRAYAREIGVDETVMLDAFREVPAMPVERFRQIAEMLFVLARQLSTMAYQNLAQVRSIAERKRVEAALRESENRLRTLIRALPDLVWFKDRDGVYQFCNSRFEAFFGAREKEIIGKTDYDFLERELADFFRNNDRLAIEKGRPSKNEETVLFC